MVRDRTGIIKAQKGGVSSGMIALISHSDCHGHDIEGHPERPARLRAIRDELIASGRISLVSEIEAPRARRADLERVHDPSYVDSIYDAAPEEGIVAIDMETMLCPGTLDAARRAAGAGIRAVDLVATGEFRSAFCAVRPPGHHAERSRAMGFCFFNNVAVAAAHAREKHGCSRVAIVDFDAHHGNGTEDIFRDDDSIFIASVFEHPWFPYSGLEETRPGIVNVPLPAGTDSSDWREAVSRRVLPQLRDSGADMLLFSAGFDGHARDPLGHFTLREDDFRWISRACREAVPAPVVSMLEGGYDLSALSRSVGAHIDGLI